MTNKNLSRLDANIHMKTLNCVVCDKEFKQNDLAYIQKCCSDECSKKNKRNLQNIYQRENRQAFKKKYGLSPSREPNVDFVYNQHLLDENPFLLETLLMIQNMKRITSKDLPEEVRHKNVVEYMREYRLKLGIKPRKLKNKK